MAGKAGHALASTGVYVQWKPAGRPDGYFQPLNPALAWQTIFDEYAILDVPVIFTCCQAAGLLEANAVEAEQREESFTGKVEVVTGFFRRLRGDRSRGEPSQYGAVLLGAVATGVVLLIVAYLTFTFGWVGG